MKAKPKIIFNTIVMLCLLLGMTAPALAKSSGSVASQPVPAALKSNSRAGLAKQAPDPKAPSGCALLDNPSVRGLMSGAFERKLLIQCGRESELGQVKSTPYAQLPADLGTDVLVNDPTTDTGASQTQSETSLAISASGVLCSAYNDSYHGVTQDTGYSGFSSSVDQGASWTDHGAVFAGPGLSYGDPSVAWSQRDGTFYFASLHDDGLGLYNFGAGCDSVTWVGDIHAGGNDDKEIMTVDNNPASPYYGRLYVAWTNFDTGDIYSTYSDNGGTTWSTPVDVSLISNVQGAWPTVDPVTNDVYIAWVHWDSYPAGPIDIQVARSTNGGVSYSIVTEAATNVTNPRDSAASATCDRPALNGNIRYLPSPQIDVDNNSNLHVVYSYDPDGYNTGDVINVYYRRSTTQGASWNSEILLNDDGTTRDQWFPALTVNPAGFVSAFWYDRRNDPSNYNYLYYGAVSLDNGVSFQPNQQISDVASPVVLDPNLAICYHGDYDTSVSDITRNYIQWSDDRLGTPDVWSDTDLLLTDIGTLTGQVTDLTTGDPILGANVFADSTYDFNATTNAGGYYTMTVAEDTYDVTASAFGYLDETVSGVDVISGTVTTQDFALDPAPVALVYGYITDATTGWPLYASFDIAGVPGGPFWNDPVTGYYEISLPQGSSYDFSVQAWVPGYTDGFQTVGPLSGDIQVDFALDADLAACTAPGYITFPYGENFEANDGGFSFVGTGTWEWGTPTSGPGAAHSGVNVWATNLAGQYNNNENSYIESPDIDMSALAGQSFNFSWWQYLQSESGYDYASVLVSNNGGSTWTTVYGPLSGSIDLAWTQHSVTLDPSYAVSNFRVRFLFTSDSSVTYNGWYIDDLSAGACIPPENGGLSVGNVYDANTSLGLNGATVTNPVGFATTVPTPDDPAVADGFYTLFAPAGTHPYTATIGGGYLPDYATVTVLANDTVQQDFSLDAGWLSSVDPTAFDIEVAQGYTRTAPLTLFNTGTAVTNFEIQELPRTGMSLNNAGAMSSTFDNSAIGLSSATRIVTMDPAASPVDARTAPQQVGLSAPVNALAPQDLLLDEGFESGVMPPPDWTVVVNNPSETWGVATLNPHSGAYYADIVYDPALVQQDEWIVSPELSLNEGSISFWSFGSLYWCRDDFDNCDLNVWIVVGDVGGGDDILVGTADADWPLNWTYAQSVFDLTPSLPGGPVRIGFQYYGLDGAEVALDDIVLDGTVASIPWLSEEPVTGTIDANSTADIAVTFDSMTYTVGTQLMAMLTVESDDPYGSMFEIPVTMTVVTATSYLEVGHLAPFAADPGTAVTVTLNGAPALTDFVYGDSTPYIELLPGDYDVAVWPAGSTTPAITGTVSLMPLTYYTAIAIGDGVNQPLELRALVDDLTPPAAGKLHLRLGHLAPFASGDALADIRLQDGTPVITDVAFSDVTAFIPLDAGEYDLKVTTPGGAITLIDPLPVTFNAGDIVSAYATGDGSNQPLGVFAWPAGVPGGFLPLASSGVELSPAAAAQSGAPGEMVTYTLTVTNTGDITDTFGITVTAGWDVDLPVAELTLGAGESADFVVQVDIPADAADGESDVATVTVMVEGVPSATAESELTTTAETPMKFVYLPLVMDGYNAP